MVELVQPKENGESDEKNQTSVKGENTNPTGNVVEKELNGKENGTENGMENGAGKTAQETGNGAGTKAAQVAENVNGQEKKKVAENIANKTAAPKSKKEDKLPNIETHRNEALSHLNKLRADQGYPKMVIDAKFCDDATKYAMELVRTTYYRKSDQNLRNGADECLYASRSDDLSSNHMKNAIDSWMGEKRTFSWEKKPLTGNSYTTIIWKSAKKLGLGMAVSEKGWIFVVGRIFPQSNVKGQFYNNLPTHSDWNFGTPKKLQIEHFNDAKDSVKTFNTAAKNVDGKYESNGSTGYRGSFSSSSFVVEDEGAAEIDPFEVFTRKKSVSEQPKHRSSVEITPKRAGEQVDSSPEKARDAEKTKKPDKKNARKSSGAASDVSYESTGTGYRGSFSSSSFVIEDDEEKKDPFEIFTRKKSVA